jgi:hypothetical protein
MIRDYPVIRSPIRRYPLPDRLTDLDKPWPDVSYNRHTRVDLFRRGHSPTDDPTRENPNISPSNILSKL